MADAPQYGTLLVVTKPPDQITFYADDPLSYKQDITIYNQYDFPLYFQVSVASSDCTRYSLDFQKGIIKEKHYTSVTLQLNTVTRANIGLTDKVRVKLSSRKPFVTSGKKELFISHVPAHEPLNEPNPLVHSSPTAESFSPYSSEARCKTCMQPLQKNPEPVEKRQEDDFFQKIKHVMIGILIGVIGFIWYGYSRS